MFIDNTDIEIYILKNQWNGQHTIQDSDFTGEGRVHGTGRKWDWGERLTWEGLIPISHVLVFKLNGEYMSVILLFFTLSTLAYIYEKIHNF